LRGTVIDLGKMPAHDGKDLRDDQMATSSHLSATHGPAIKAAAISSSSNNVEVTDPIINTKPVNLGRWGS
jgi:hypothetical protein